MRNIFRNIIQSEIDGGCDWSTFPEEKILSVKTKSTHFRLIKMDGKTYISGHKEFCPGWTECILTGSTWDGATMLKINFIGRGMHMQFVPVKASYERVTTGKILEIYEGE